MAIVQGIKEKVHLPIYDSLAVEPEKQLREVEASSTLKFFVNVQGRTKLETNLQSASLLPHYNTFEARAMRVVISDLPPTFPEDPKAQKDELEVTNATGNPFDNTGKAKGSTGFDGTQVVTAEVDIGLNRLMELLAEARDDGDKKTKLGANDPDVSLSSRGGSITPAVTQTIEAAGGEIELSVKDLEDIIDTLEKKAPAKEQIRPNDGAGTIIGKLIYNTVTTLYVGEKIMIQMPTWFFPAGAGPYSEKANVTTHGEPSPTATFRFAEPIFVDKQQNFRVEIEIPDSETLKDIQKIYGPLNIWVVLDGYMTRDVQ
jgi:hypothetical protein